jgi:carbon-monoxide dehydrogenase small subunit
MQHIISFTLNGEKVEAMVKDNVTLLDFLRDTMGLTGTKKGCEEGECGACTIMLNGKPVNSCLVLAMEVQDQEVITIEGLASNGKLNPIQQEFIDKWALQCGYCTPGMIMSAKALLDVNPSPTEEEIRDAIAGNLCRCTGYAKIVEAISAVAPLVAVESEGKYHGKNI